MDFGSGILLVTMREKVLNKEIKMQGMIARNKQCELNGEQLFYCEDDFLNLANESAFKKNDNKKIGEQI